MHPYLLLTSSLIAIARLLGQPALAQVSEEAPLTVGARTVPVPDTVSPRLRQLIARKYVNGGTPQTPEGWRALVATASSAEVARVPSLKAQFDVEVEPKLIAGVHCFIVTPRVIPARHRDRLLVHVHGGAYVLFPGVAATPEAIIMAGVSHTRVISIDYRMPPDFPYPAAMDDAMAVWKVVVTQQKPKNIAIFGTSTGGGMTLAMVQRAKEENLPLPGAIAPGTPWSDLTKTGDSYFVNESIDNILGAYEPFLAAAANLYANGRDLKDPHLSPVNGEFKGFPPTILTTGTRDLFLSNTVRVHRKLREANVIAELEVFEGQSHADYIIDATTPESKEAFEEIAKFFDTHLGR